MTRDTDADWIELARHHPYFGVLAEPQYFGHRLEDSVRERFYATGEPDVAFAIDTIRQRFDEDFHPRLAVDFGSGVGRLSVHMRAHAERVIGVDVAPAMRDVAREEVERRGLSGVEFAADAPSDGVDWVLSQIVFQHIPPSRGYGLIDHLARSLTARGALSIHVTTHRDERHLAEVFRDVRLARFDGAEMKVLDTRSDAEVGAMSMYDYDLGRIVALLTGLGFERFWLDHADHAGMHGYWIFSQRAG